MAAKKKSSRSESVKKKTNGRSQDAIGLLKADHAKVKELFSQFESARTDNQKQKLAQTICQELTVHTTIEEEIFYPAARESIEEADLVDEAEVEHQSAKDLISQIQAGNPSDEKWEAKVKVLSEYINHHVKEEETELFPQVRDTDLDLKALGEQLLARKQELAS
jgi:hemerythrin superfamily protein